MSRLRKVRWSWRTPCPARAVGPRAADSVRPDRPRLVVAVEPVRLSAELRPWVAAQLPRVAVAVVDSPLVPRVVPTAAASKSVLRSRVVYRV